MKKLYLLCSLLLIVFSGLSQTRPETQVSFDFQGIRSQLQAAPVYNEGEKSRPDRLKLIITLPWLNGTTKSFFAAESRIISPQMAEEFPDLKTYSVLSTKGDVYGRITLDDHQLFATFFSDDAGIVTLEPTEAGVYQLYDASNDPNPSSSLSCATQMGMVKGGRISEALSTLDNNCFQFGNSIRTYRFAVVVTTEFAQQYGGAPYTTTNVATAITAVLNSVNVIYQRDLSVTFTLVASPIIPAATAGPDGSLGTADDLPADDGITINCNSRTSTANTQVGANFASNTYDIGHIFHTGNSPAGCGGGVAQLGSACGVSKAAGWAEFLGTIANSGNVNLLAHEIGHMLNANHTFNSISSFCGNTGQFNQSSAYEIGGGTSIMAYPTFCAPDNVASGGNSHFHSHSITEMNNFITSGSGNCATVTACSNNMISSNANPVASNFNIPPNTAFTLTGAATDTDGLGSAIYSWEQYDRQDSANPVSPPSAGASLPNTPLFKMLTPSTAVSRTFPFMPAILNGQNNYLGEYLPTIARTMNFRFIARDRRNLGGSGCNSVACDAITVNVLGSQPFKFTKYNTATKLRAGCAETITWNIGGTNTAPISCANVDIDFSSDGGTTWTSIIAGTPNDGSHPITVPATTTSQGRFRIKCSSSDRIFFDINDIDFTVFSSCSGEISSLLNASAVSLPQGNAGLNLNPCEMGAINNTFTGTIDTNDPSTRVVLNSGTVAAPTCATPYGNAPYYQVIPFRVDAAGNYTITITAGGGTALPNRVMNLYNGPVNGSASCTNWMTSNTLTPANVTGGPITDAALSTCTTYYLMVSGFSTGQVGSYSVTFSGAGNARLLTALSTSGNAYTYVIVDNATGNIVAFDPDANLSNGSVYTQGKTYTVQGLSVAGNASLTSFVGGQYSALTTALNDNSCTGLCGAVSSNSIRVNIQAPTPVELIGFSAKALEDRHVEVTWATASELNSKSFVLERSEDAATFSAIATLDAAGNSSVRREYKFLDEKPIQGVNYYRLKQYDLDGTLHQYRPVAVLIGTDKEVISPNPTDGPFSIQMPQAAMSKFVLFDVSGQAVECDVAVEGKETVRLNPRQKLTPGMYLLQIDTFGYRRQQKIMVR